MGFDSLLVGIILVALVLGVLALVIGKGFIRRGSWAPALETQWHVLLAVIVCLALALVALSRQNRELQEQLDDLKERMEQYQENQ
jgi:membrane protein implicated in regulation of membrane protease activity